MLLRLTQEELDELTAKAKRTNYSREEFCRRILSGATVKEAPTADVRELIREMRRVGYNIGQLLKRANSTGFVDLPQFRKDMDEVREAVKLIASAYTPED